MMQNLLLTSFTPLKNKNEITCWENRPFQTVWPENVQQNKKDITKTIKKRKRVRTAFTTQQIEALEKIYSSNKYVSSKERAAIANTLKISDRTVKIWFQNRRMKAKKESYESSCDSTNESDITKTIKKHKRFRTAFKTQQIEALEKIYSSNKYVSSGERAAIANSLKICDRSVKIWFQNRRRKAKRESSESSCDSSNDSDITKPIKKRKRVRTAFKTQQIEALEKIYSTYNYVSSAERAEIANRLKISERSVKIWFQNKRSKAKR
ncbi:hypothetical protein PYW07_016522 [Mythimna separata]|uniref:Homeobox domain-containing protein n=1 Tax=Mythimna separata TaxID=271217 RepID=A0AAD8DRM8_MYTSE|nr:hypothetical protein PYW07_016522 [Mythimna separata]